MRLTRRAALAALALPSLACAQAAPLRIVVPFPPGGGADAVARQVQQPLAELLGQTVLVENRPGASGALGSAVVARSAADGLTWLLVFDSHTVNPALIPDLGFDTARDFQPVIRFGTGPMLLNAHHSRPWHSPAELLATARARPEALTYGTIGNGTLAHLAMSVMQRATGVRLTHVPYRGGGPLALAAVAGEVDLSIATQTIFNTHYASGMLVPVLQTGLTRSPRFPALPTMAEAGVPGLDARAFWGLVGPAGLAAPVLVRMVAALTRVLANPTVREKLGTLGLDLAAPEAPMGPEPFAAFLAQQTAFWGQVVRENGIRGD